MYVFHLKLLLRENVLMEKADFVASNVLTRLLWLCGRG